MQTVASDQPVILEALDELRERQATAAACQSLDVELGSLQVEALELEGRDEELRERTAAAQRMQRFEADRLIVLGKSTTPEHEKSSALVQELKAEAVTIEQWRQKISQRCETIEAARKTALRRSAEEFRDAAIALIRGAENSLASILDETRTTLNTLEMQLGTSLYLPHELTSGERTNEWITLNRLYGGRAR